VANEGISGDAAAAQYINCVIDGNTATRNLDWQSNPARGGGGLFINLSTPQVIHCTITANTVGLGAAVPGNPNHGLTSGGIFNVTVGTLPATAGDFFGVKNSGAIYGLMLIGWSIGGIIGPLLISWLVGEDQAYTLGFTVMGAIALVGLIIPFLAKPPKHA